MAIIVAGLKAAEPVLVPVILGFFLSALTFPVMRWLERRKIPHFLAVFLTVGMVISVVVLLLFIGTNVLAQFQQTVPKYGTELKGLASEWGEKVDEWSDRLDRYAGVPEEEAADRVPAKETFLKLLDFDAVIRLVRSAEIFEKTASFLSTSFFVLLVMVFILAEAPGFKRRLVHIRKVQGPNFRAMQNASNDIQRYLSIKTLISLATGTLAGFWCYLFDLDFPVLWGLVAFLLNYIPAIGSVLAGIPPVLLALVQQGGWHASGVGAGYLAINILLGNFIEPTLLGRRFGISTLVVVLSVLVWGFIWGGVGMFLAVPLTMIVKVWLDNTHEFRWISVAMGKGDIANGKAPPPKKSEAPAAGPENRDADPPGIGAAAESQ